MPKNNENLGKIEFLLANANEKIKRQADTWSELDQKTGLIFGFISTIIVAAGILLGDCFGLNFLTVGGVFLVFSLTAAAASLWTRTFWDPIDLDNFYTKGFLAQETVNIKNKAFADTKKCYEINSGIIESKSRFFKISLFLLILGLVLVIVGVAQLKYNSRKEVCLMPDDDKRQEQRPVEPVEPHDKPGDIVEKKKKVEPVEPNKKPGNAIPFGEPKGGIKPEN